MFCSFKIKNDIIKKPTTPDQINHYKSNMNPNNNLNSKYNNYNSIHKLPDGRKIRISSERFEAPEILFHPYLIRNESPGVHEMLYNAINVSKIFYIIFWLYLL